MTNYEVYDSINHLLDFAQWEEVFDRAREHLNDRSIFWDIRVFEHLGNSSYHLHSEGIREVSFPRAGVEESLHERFARVSTQDERRARPTSRSERLHFVCQS